VQKLVGFGDNRTSKIVAKIAEEEVAHVAVGLYWFLSVCQKMGRAPDSTFKGWESFLTAAYLLTHHHKRLSNSTLNCSITMQTC
jgi:uncharacterized ferritin-like protein (DUF455 family)